MGVWEGPGGASGFTPLLYIPSIYACEAKPLVEVIDTAKLSLCCLTDTYKLILPDHTPAICQFPYLLDRLALPHTDLGPPMREGGYEKKRKKEKRRRSGIKKREEIREGRSEMRRGREEEEGKYYQQEGRSGGRG